MEPGTVPEPAGMAGQTRPWEFTLPAQDDLGQVFVPPPALCSPARLFLGWSKQKSAGVSN